MAREGLAQHPSSSLPSIPTAELTSERIYGAAVDGDPLALDVFRKAGAYLGIAMANVINVFNPEMIVIGGGVSAAWDLLVQPGRGAVLRAACPGSAGCWHRVGAERGAEAGSLGAACGAFCDELLE